MRCDDGKITLRKMQSQKLQPLQGVRKMEKADAGRMGGNKKNLRRLHTRVTAQIDILEEDYG